jgi:hypothetical protein
MDPMFKPPIKQKIRDARILGVGTSKMVWTIDPADDYAVINAFDDQRTEGLPKYWTLEEKINYNNTEIKIEYNFTAYLRTIFGDLIPEVFLFKDNPFKDYRFRYAKQLCTPVEVSDVLFHQMVHIVDMVLQKGWVYLDMKPANLGVRNGKICIVDTDPQSFYRIQPEMVPYFRLSSYMIILEFSRNFLPFISVATLVQFIRDRKILYKDIETVYHFDPSLRAIAKYGDTFFDKELITLKTVMHPRDFFDAYGGKGTLYVLKELMDLADKPVTPPIPKVVTPIPKPVTPPIPKPVTPPTPDYNANYVETPKLTKGKSKAKGWFKSKSTKPVTVRKTDRKRTKVSRFKRTAKNNR